MAILNTVITYPEFLYFLFQNIKRYQLSFSECEVMGTH